MATEIYVLHPGVGQNRAGEGATLRAEEGTSFKYMMQEFPPSADKETDLHGVVVPPNLLTGVSDKVLFRAVFRQVTAGSGNTNITLKWQNIAPPDGRHTATPSPGADSPQTWAAPGADDEEAVEFEENASLFATGEELLLQVGREVAGQTFAGTIALVRIDIEFPIVGGGGAGLWTDGGAHIYPSAGAGKEVSVGKITAPTAPGAIMEVAGGHLQVGGTWNGPHFIMGTPPNDWHFWIDPNVGTGVLRTKKTAPLSVSDGDIVGSQS